MQRQLTVIRGDLQVLIARLSQGRALFSALLLGIALLGAGCDDDPWAHLCEDNGGCGDNAECTVVDAKVVCECYPGFAGDECNHCAPGLYGSQCSAECPGGVDNVCSGNGTCRDGLTGTGSCSCKAGFKGRSCNECADGYYGKDCKEQCPGGYLNICHGGGICDDGRAGDGSCSCFPGFSGSDCATCATGHGGPSCSACPRGPVNEDGQLSSNAKVCSGHGLCKASREFGAGVCECDDGYGGEACSECAPDRYGAECKGRCPVSSNNLVCNGRGACSDGFEGDGTCSCDEGWGGQFCDRCKEGWYGLSCGSECPGNGVKGPCNGNGTCDGGFEGYGTCDCKPGFTGDACEQCEDGHFGPNCLPCPGGAYSPCNDRGTCDEGIGGSGLCECESGYGSDCGECPAGRWGERCENECPGGAATPCSGQGTCDSGIHGYGTCQCKEGFSGDSCNTCDEGLLGENCDKQCGGGDGWGMPCSGVGSCELNEQQQAACVCPANRSGEFCEECAEGFYGWECEACPADLDGKICGGHGSCDEGIDGSGDCVCDAPFALDYSGDPDTTGLCVECLPGHYGEECLSCPGYSESGAYPMVCNDLGQCDDGRAGSGECECDYGHGDECSFCPDGFFGENCEDECPGGFDNACNGRGICNDDTQYGDGYCTCTATGWTGTACDECDEGFGGDNCEPCPKAGNQMCGGRGSCGSDEAGNAVCECWENWAGAACDVCPPGYYGQGCYQQCPGGADNACFGNGTCNDGQYGSGKCTCDDGFNIATNCETCLPQHSGPDCHICPNGPDNPCNGNGICYPDPEASKQYRCECDGNFTGSECDECLPGWFGDKCHRQCPGGAENPCNGRGTCNEAGYCVRCDQGWTGEACDECDYGFFGSSCQACPGLDPEEENYADICQGGECDDGLKGSGECFSCGQGFQGTYCDSCKDNYYGPNCMACPSDNDGRVCGGYECADGIDGSGSCDCPEGFEDAACTYCKHGYFGESCDPCPGGAETPCSNRGFCNNDGVCECTYDTAEGNACESCLPFHYGAACQACPGLELNGDPDEVCGSVGTCREGPLGDGGCDCPEGFDEASFCTACLDNHGGEDCDACPKDADGDVCGSQKGRGSCSEGLEDGTGTCDCYPGFTGDACDTCLPGFAGEYCQACAGGSDPVCSGHGECNDGMDGDGSCTCAPGFDVATDCELCLDGHWGPNCTPCPGGAGNACYGNGYCSQGLGGDGSCECTGEGFDPEKNCQVCLGGYWGPDCLPCPGLGVEICDGEGTCNDGLGGDGSCQCSGNFTGENCDICRDGWYGEGCDQECPGGYQNACFGNGECIDGKDGSGACICDISGNFDPSEDCAECESGWYGTACDKQCPGFGTCSENGQCNDGVDGDGKCTCDTGFVGIACDQCAPGRYGGDCLACPGGAGTPCNLRGDCDDGIEGSGYCENCDTGWIGLACDECAYGFMGSQCEECPGGANEPCNGVGECYAFKTGALCECEWGYAGADCSECAPNTNEYCSDCARGFYGEDCELCPGPAGYACSSPTGGQGYGHGTCSEGREGSGLCECGPAPGADPLNPRTWEGDYCQYLPLAGQRGGSTAQEKVTSCPAGAWAVGVELSYTGSGSSLRLRGFQLICEGGVEDVRSPWVTSSASETLTETLDCRYSRGASPPFDGDQMFRVAGQVVASGGQGIRGLALLCFGGGEEAVPLYSEYLGVAGALEPCSDNFLYDHGTISVNEVRGYVKGDQISGLQFRCTHEEGL